MAFVFWSVIGILLAGVAALIARIRPGPRHPFVALVGWSFAALASSAGVFLVQAAARNVWLDQSGLSDQWRCPLSNGYGIELRSASVLGSLLPKRGFFPTLRDVRNVGTSGEYLMGSVYSNRRGATFFLLNTQAGGLQDFLTREELFDAAGQLGVSAKLEPIEVVFGRCRSSSLDRIELWATLVAIAVGLAACGLLVRRFLQRRQPAL